MKYLLALCLLFPTPVWAGEAQPEKGTVVSLSSTAEALLENDEAVVDFRIEAAGGNAAALQAEVNAIARKVKAVLDRQAGLKQQTTGRSLQPMSHYDKASGRQVRDGWRLVQSERVVSLDLDAVPVWVDGIERAGGHLDRLSFGISDQTGETALERLRIQAVQQFRTRAAALASTLDAPSFRILNLRSDNRMPPAPVMQRGVVAMSAANAAPTLNAGESRLSVTVSGEILLPDRRFMVK